MLSFLFGLILTARAAEPRGFVRGLIGVIRESRILIAPDSMFDQGEPTKFGDNRLVTNGEIGHHTFVSGRHRFGPEGLLALTNTAQNHHAAGDPYRFAIAAPYVLNFDSTHDHRLIVRPSYQSLMMDPSLTSRKTVVQNAAMLNVLNTWHTGESWDLGAEIEYRRDDATLRQSVGPNDADANKFTLRGHASHFGGERRRRVVEFDLGAIRNQALGKYRRYDRIEAGARVNAPLWRDWTYQATLRGYQLNFPASNPRREDLNGRAGLGLRVPIGGAFAVQIDAEYARNFGRRAPYNYDRVTILSALTLDAPL